MRDVLLLQKHSHTRLVLIVPGPKILFRKSNARSDLTSGAQNAIRPREDLQSLTVASTVIFDPLHHFHRHAIPPALLPSPSNALHIPSPNRLHQQSPNRVFHSRDSRDFARRIRDPVPHSKSSIHRRLARQSAAVRALSLRVTKDIDDGPRRTSMIQCLCLGRRSRGHGYGL